MAFPLLGESAALATAICWALTALAFESAGRRVGSLPVNLIRLLIGWLCLVGLVWFRRGIPFPTDASAETDAQPIGEVALPHGVGQRCHVEADGKHRATNEHQRTRTPLVGQEARSGTGAEEQEGRHSEHNRCRTAPRAKLGRHGIEERSEGVDGAERNRDCRRGRHCDPPRLRRVELAHIRHSASLRER